MSTGNLVFQRLFLILKEADALCETLKEEWESCHSDEAENKLRDAYQIRNRTFAALMREGVRCDFIKDLELGNNEIITIALHADSERYECRAIVLKQLLGDDYSSVLCKCGFGNKDTEHGGSAISQKCDVDKKPVPELTVMETSEPHTKKKKISNQKQTQSSEAKESEKPVEVNAKDNDISSEKPNIMAENMDGTTNGTLAEENPDMLSDASKDDGARPFHYQAPDVQEPVKSIDTMVFELNDVGVFNKADGKGEYVNFTVVPLNIPPTGSELVSDIIVCIETLNEKKVFVSEKSGKKSVSVNIGDYEFIVRGSWKDGKFTSTLYSAIEAAADSFDKHEEKTVFEPKDFSTVGFGHNVCFFEENDGTISKIHVIPIDLQNNAAGMVNVMVCVEKADGTRHVDVSNNNMVIYKTKGCEAQIFGYWEDDKTFVAHVKKR